MNTYTISKKILGIGALAAVCLVASLLVMGLIAEREQRYNEAQHEIGDMWGLEQTILGPVLVFEERVEDEETKYTYVLPSKLAIDTFLEPETRSRGIFDTIVYVEKIKVSGSFTFENVDKNLLSKNPKLVVSLTDTRSIENQVALSWNTATFPFSPGTSNNFFEESGIQATVPLTTSMKEYDFSFDVTLHGNGSTFFIPVGKETVVTVSSPWQSPEFVGAYLPASRTMTTEGFSATWNVSSFGRNYPQVWQSDSAIYKETLMNSRFGVSLFEGVGLYTQVFRSVKYAVLFILITFTVFFLFEILGNLRIHPIQYLLIGSSLALFYLLLLSLTEHIGFLLAYIVATTMITILITMYSVSVLKQKWRSLSIFLLLTSLYSYMYFVLQLEDYALLFGSLLVFALLSLVMYLTRTIDWYTFSTDNKM